MSIMGMKMKISCTSMVLLTFVLFTILQREGIVAFENLISSLSGCVRRNTASASHSNRFVLSPDNQYPCRRYKVKGFWIGRDGLRTRQTTYSLTLSGLASNGVSTTELSALAPTSEAVFSTIDGISFTPMFDFGSPNTTVVQQSIDAFDRIDDVIMGGISSSTLQLKPDLLAASWSGVVRIDGGGFCGFRTLPFVYPYDAKGQDGIYFRLRFVSDNEPYRRVWKVTVRTDTSRGELVYQAPISIPPTTTFPILPSSLNPTENTDSSSSLNEDNPKTFYTVMVPFKDFKLVRGPRMVPEGPPIDVSGGLYQIGMTCSKFQMATNTTQLDNFRPGYFNLLIKDIGLYRNTSVRENYDITFQLGDNTGIKTLVPKTMTKEESKKKLPILIKLLRPISILFFTETGNRRKSAMNLLTSKRGMTKWKAFWLGVSYRSKAMGILKGGILKTVSILSIDCLRFLFGSLIRYGIFLPIRVVSRTLKLVKNSSNKRNPQT